MPYHHVLSDQEKRELLRIARATLREYLTTGFMPPLKTSCADHEGSGVVRFMRWDGTRWNVITGWMAPLPEDRKLVHEKYLQSATKYAKDKGITPRACAPHEQG